MQRSRWTLPKDGRLKQPVCAVGAARAARELRSSVQRSSTDSSGAPLRRRALDGLLRGRLPHHQPQSRSDHRSSQLTNLPPRSRFGSFESSKPKPLSRSHKIKHRRAKPRIHTCNSNGTRRVALARTRALAPCGMVVTWPTFRLMVRLTCRPGLCHQMTEVWPQ